MDTQYFCGDNIIYLIHFKLSSYFCANNILYLSHINNIFILFYYIIKHTLHMYYIYIYLYIWLLL